MGLFLFRFWPVLIPLLAYYLWFLNARARARKKGEPLPHFRDGPLYWAILASFGLALACFLFAGLSHAPNDGQYVPPHMEDGKLIPGRVEP